MAALVQIAAQYGINSEQVAIQKEKIDALGTSINKTKEGMSRFAAEFMLKMMQAQGAPTSLQIAFAQASGLIDASSAEMIRAIDDVNKDFEQGKTTVSEYLAKVMGLINGVFRLNGMSATAYINIEVSGSIPSFFGGSRQVSTPGGKWGAMPKGVHAKGGKLREDVAMVGEEGYELAVKQPGGSYLIIPHEASKWMVAAGMWSGRGLGKGGPLMPWWPTLNMGIGEPDMAQRVSSGKQWFQLPQLSRSVSRSGGGGGGGGGAGGGMADAAPVEAAQQQAEAANEAVKAAANVASVSSESSLRQATQSTQIINTIARGNEDLVDIMISVDRQIRDLRSEMPDALKAAIQQVI